MSFNNLFKRINETSKKVSRDTFNSHIKNLVYQEILYKKDSGLRGKPVYYSLTNKCKQELNLKIRGHKLEEQNTKSNDKESTEKRRKLYAMITLLAVFIMNNAHRSRKQLFFKTKEQLEKFLSSIGSSKDDLIIQDECGEYKYYSTIVTIYRPVYDIRIYKHEKCLKSGDRVLKQYACFIPGITVSDFFDKSRTLFENINFSQKEIEEAIELLVNKEHIMRPAVEYNGETTYVIADESLFYLIGDLYSCSFLIGEKILMLWSFVRKPTKDEIKWAESLRGRKESDAIRMKAYSTRKSLPKVKRREFKKEAEEGIRYIERCINEEINSINASYIETIRKYRFLVDALKQIVYPQYIENCLAYS